MPTSLWAIAEKASTTGPVRKRTVLKSPVRENCTPGSVRGRSGNWPTYLDAVITIMKPMRLREVGLVVAGVLCGFAIGIYTYLAFFLLPGESRNGMAMFIASV